MTEKIEITSTQNNLVKYCVKLLNPHFRKQEKVILLDGIKTITGLLDSGVEFEYLFSEEKNLPKNLKNIKTLILTDEKVLSKISSTKSYSKYIGIIKEPKVEKNIFKTMEKIALVENIKDAGNLGTIIRSAAAFSIDGIILFGDCVDLYNPKAIRASAQNMFKIPILRTSDFEFIKELKKNHKMISTVVDSSLDLFDLKIEENFLGNFIVALGSEASGLSQEMAQISDILATIKMDNDVESLNLAICASIVFSRVKSIRRLRKL